MARRDPKEDQGRTLGSTSSVVPAAQRLNAHAEGMGEPGLRQADEALKRRDVPAAKVTSGQALADASRDGPSEIARAELRYLVSHGADLGRCQPTVENVTLPGSCTRSEASSTSIEMRFPEAS